MVIYFTTDPPDDLENHPYQNRWKHGACDVLEVTESDSKLIRNIPDPLYITTKCMMDMSVMAQKMDRATFEDMAEYIESSL